MKLLKMINRNTGQSKRVIGMLVQIGIQFKDVQCHKFSIGKGKWRDFFKIT